MFRAIQEAVPPSPPRLDRFLTHTRVRTWLLTTKRDRNPKAERERLRGDYECNSRAANHHDHRPLSLLWSLTIERRSFLSPSFVPFSLFPQDGRQFLVSPEIQSSSVFFVTQSGLILLCRGTDSRGKGGGRARRRRRRRSVPFSVRGEVTMERIRGFLRTDSVSWSAIPIASLFITCEQAADFYKIEITRERI